MLRDPAGEVKQTMRDLIGSVVDWCQAHLGLSANRLGDIALTVLAWAVFVGLRIAIGRLLERRVDDVARRYAVTKTLNYILGFLFFVAAMVIWFGGLTGWSAYLGIMSAGLAIALQDPLVNLVGWLFIAVRKPFVVGDRIEVGGHRGDVIDQRLFQFTLIEIGNWVDADQSTGRIIHVPNGWVFRQSTANYTAGFRFIWDEIAVMVTFESNWEEAKKILLGAATRHAHIKDEEASDEVRKAGRKYMIYFQHLTPIVWTSVADSGVVLTMRYICEPRRRRSTTTAIWEEVLREFATRRDIDFAYPTTRFYDNRAEGKPGTGGPASTSQT